MYRSPRQVKPWMPVLALGTILTGATPALAGPKLVLNGKTASSDVRVINGKAFVAVADVAKALGMVVVKRGDGYEIKKPGGTYQVGNMQGKIGDVLFDGRWRFQVLEVKEVESYTMKAPTVEPLSGAWDLLTWDRATQVMRSKPGYKLIHVQCRVTNGQKEKKTLWTAPSDETVRTALTDMNGGSHVPAAYDYPGAAIQTKPLLPGEILNFPLLFSVPQDTKLKDLVFTLKNNNWQERGNDVRVSLTP